MRDYSILDDAANVLYKEHTKVVCYLSMRDKQLNVVWDSFMYRMTLEETT